MDQRSGIRQAHSLATDSLIAVREIAESLCQENTELVLLFCSHQYPADELAAAIKSQFQDINVVGCTSAGEIGPRGYVEGSLCGISFSRDYFHAQAGILSHLNAFEPSFGHDLVRELADKLPPPDIAPPCQNRRFAIQLIDGSSKREEIVTRSLQSALGKSPIIGGSAGANIEDGVPLVYFDGAFHEDAAVVILVSTSLPTSVFRNHHFVPVYERMVVTNAIPSLRRIVEINGYPAANEIARILGVDQAHLDLADTLEEAISVRVHDETFIRSLRKVNEDGSVDFFCAIDKGSVLRIAIGHELLEKLRQTFTRLQSEIGLPVLTLGFDCVHRKTAIDKRQDRGSIENLLIANNTLGCSTFGEQYRGVHMNQSFVGIAFGYPLPE